VRRVLFAVLFLLLICGAGHIAQAVTILELRCMQLENPLLASMRTRPRLSWKVSPMSAARSQTAYENPRRRRRARLAARQSEFVGQGKVVSGGHDGGLIIAERLSVRAS